MLPVIWCYCFFDTFHVAKLPEEIREFEDQDCWDTVAAFVKSDPLKRFEEKKTLAGVLILLAALYTMIYGVFLPFFRWSEELRLVRMALMLFCFMVMMSRSSSSWVCTPTARPVMELNS